MFTIPNIINDWSSDATDLLREGAKTLRDLNTTNKIFTTLPSAQNYAYENFLKEALNIAYKDSDPNINNTNSYIDVQRSTVHESTTLNGVISGTGWMDPENKKFTVKIIRIINNKQDPISRVPFLRDCDDQSILDKSQELTGPALIMQNSTRHAIRIFKMGNKLIILTNRYDFKLLSQIIALTVALYKDLFKQDSLSKKIYKVLNAFPTGDNQKIEQAIHELLNAEEIKDFKYNILKPYFRPNILRQLEAKKIQLKNTQETINHLERQLINNYSTEEKLNEEILIFTKADPEDKSEEVIDYIKHNKAIEHFAKGPSASRVEITFVNPIVFYDKDVYLHLENARARMKTRTGTEEAPDIIEARKAIFLEQKYELWTRCGIVFDTVDFQVSRSLIRFHTQNNDLIEHPHINRLNCFGTHYSAIKASVQTLNYINAIGQIEAASKNINFNDSIVSGLILNELPDTWRDNKTIKDKETGEFITFNQLRERIKNGKNKTDGGGEADNLRTPER